VSTFERSQFDVEQVAMCLKQTVYNERINLFFLKGFKNKNWLKGISATLGPILYIVMPKCPFCLAAYLSVFGITGLQINPYFNFLLPVIIVITWINLIVLRLIFCSNRSCLAVF